MSSFRALGRDLVAYGVLGGLSRSVNLLLLPFLTRYFSPTEYGVIDVVATLSALVTVFGSLNLESAVARLWVDRSPGARRARLVSTALATVSLVAVVSLFAVIAQSAAISALLLRDRAVNSYVVLGVLGGLVGSLFTIPQVVLRMQRRIALYNLLSVLQTVLYIGGAVILVARGHEGLRGVFLAQVLAGTAAFLLGLVFIRETIRPSVSLREAGEALRYSLPQLPATAAVWVNAQMDRMFLLFFLGLGSVGVFGAASRLVSVMSLLAGGFQQAWTPLAIRMISDPDPRKRSQFYGRVLNYYLGALLIIALLMTSVAKELLSALAPEEYRAAFVVVPWLAGAHVLQGSSAITNLGMLVTKRTVGNSIAAWAGVAVNASLCVSLIPLFGIRGAAFGMFLAGLVFTALLWRFSVRVTDIAFDVWSVTATIVTYVAASAVLLGVYRAMADGISSIGMRIAIALAGSVAIAVITLRASPLDLSVLRSKPRSGTGP
jgi:O-antigen/teichoic acid export membrane protein